MWALHKGRRTVGEELSWVGPCGARNPIGVPETGIDRATVANAEEHTTLLTRLMDAIASTPSSQRSDGRHGRRAQDEIGADTPSKGRDLNFPESVACGPAAARPNDL